MAAKSKNQPIIVKKVIEENHGGHHGGAWKVAYADFVTAMMAFFLLLWILASSDEKTLEGIADYFTPTTSAVNGAGGDGLMSGTTIGPPGTMNSSNSPISTVAVPAFGQQDPMDAASAAPDDAETKSEEQAEAENVQGEIEKALKEKDEQRFADLEKNIIQAMNENPDLKPLVENLIFERTEEGLRIQIVDQEGRSMFASGSAEVSPRTRELMRLLGGMMASLPNNLLISGHTDSVPFANEDTEQGYGNWELSADRANATRRIFVNAGIATDRVTRIAGLASTEPLKPEDPEAAVNRRISVVLEYLEAPSAEDIMKVNEIKDHEGTIYEEVAPKTPPKEELPDVQITPQAYISLPERITIQELKEEASGGH